MEPIHRLRIFISSPSDLVKERQEALKVIAKLSKHNAIKSRYELFPLTYETDVPPVNGIPAQYEIAKYMGEARDCQIVICMLWARVGSPFRDMNGIEHPSGTLYEYTTAYEAAATKGAPVILLYRKTAPPPPAADPDQQQQVAAFFRRFEGVDSDLKGIYKLFRTPKEFHDALEIDLANIIQALAPPSPERADCR